MTYKLLDSGWLSGKVLSRVAPGGTPAFTAASSFQRARYAYLASDSTQTYSDGTPGKTIF